jgi:cell wall-associated NlpC family hydrolase
MIMKLTKKIIGTFLSLSIFILPSIAEAKTKGHSTKKASHHAIKVSKKAIHTKMSKKASRHVAKISKKAIHARISHKHIKITKASYSYGQRVYGDYLEPNKDIYKYALGLLGTKYTFGGTSINGIDCSSFVQHVFELAGFKLPRTAREQARYGYFVRKENLKPGDLLFFATYASFPSHVGIYIGDGKMIHASSKGGRVEVANINEDFYKRRFLFAKRIPDNIKDLKEVEDVDSIEQYMNDNTSEKDKENDPIAKIIREKNGKD